MSKHILPTHLSTKSIHTAQFIKLVSVASWLWVSQATPVRSEQLGLIAQSTTACAVSSLTAGDLSTSGTPPTGLTGTVSITITCPSGVGGTDAPFTRLLKAGDYTLVVDATITP